jgi:GNAT superfamily N-acetyltransferase
VHEFSFRTGRPEDADEIARTLEAGFERYREFAPEGWESPPVAEERIRARLSESLVWCRVAESDGAMAGHVAFMPAELHEFWPDEGDPRLAHFWQLFVREPHWGSGIAVTLHSAAVAEATARGFSSFRLYTPAAQMRARRFYEREGWSIAGAPFLEETIGMELVEYRRPLAFT